MYARRKEGGEKRRERKKMEKEKVMVQCEEEELLPGSAGESVKENVMQVLEKVMERMRCRRCVGFWIVVIDY